MSNRPNLSRLGVLEIIGAGPGGRIWEMAESPSGDYLYAAASGDGIYTFNITDPEAPTLEGITDFDESSGVEFEGECSDLVVVGNELIVCGRAINWNDDLAGPPAAPGCVAKYDISGANESSPSWTAAVTLPDTIFYRSRGQGNTWSQSLDSDGTYLYLACQYDGLHILNLSTLASEDVYGWDELNGDANFYLYNGTNTTNESLYLTDSTNPFPNDDSLVGKTVANITKGWFGTVADRLGTSVLFVLPREPSSGFVATDLGTTLWENGDAYAVMEPNVVWETSRIVYSDGWVYMANHGNGVMAIDVGTTPGSANSSNVTLIDVPQASAPDNGADVQLRPRNVWVDREWLYATPNTTTGNDEPNRGLMVAHIPADPSIMDRTFWYNYEIGAIDNDTPWSGAGDRPLMGGTFKDKYFYIANGQRGLAVYNILDPTDTPSAGDVSYEGTFGTGTMGTANLYTATAITRSGKTYLYYGDGFQANALQEHNLYYDLLEPEGKNMFTIGYHGSTGTANTAFVLDDRAICASRTADGYTYTAAAGDRVKYFEIRVEDNSGAKTWNLCLYEVESDVPTNIVPGSEVTITNSFTTGSTVRTLRSADVDIGLTAGVEYAVAVSNITGVGGGGNPTIIHDGGSSTARRDSTVTGGAFNNPFVNSTTARRVAASAVGSNGGAGGTGTIISTII